ncbi:MAG TPA: alpha-ketoglutarate-dependent dioxygenase AlkB [Acidimicrobiales bacterium]|nr:alpha-ketoglutarate-dependent dioxygenase AlkB [Acidimicrobiales bacterium]
MVSTAVAAPSMEWQSTLLGGGEPLPDRDFHGQHRIRLGSGAWVDLVPGWLSGCDTLFEELLGSLDWRSHQIPMYDRVVPQPRLSARWGDDDTLPWPPAVRLAAQALRFHYRVPFETFGANLYRHGEDSVAWHGDRVHRDQPRALVAVLTLGATRTFLLRPRGGGTSVRLRPAAGDLLVMGGTCQRTWQHCVPKTSRPVGPRISVTLRPRPGSLIPADRADRNTGAVQPRDRSRPAAENQVRATNWSIRSPSTVMASVQ